jgi:Fe-S-cluster containining protein
MKINCEGCGKCCFSDIPNSWYLGQRVFDYEESLKHPKRENIIILTPEEVRSFWEENLGCSLKVDNITFSEEKKELFLFVTIKNFPKLIDGKWVLCCPFLDSHTKKCRIYGTDFFPNACKEYPFTNMNEGYDPLCDSGRLIGELDEHQ